ncbi:MAG: hypothetical protein KGH75_11650 [Rhodospirillales bacterium]|nr:hypothetical protein [Rhodospirillales bacterium]
MQDQPKSLWGLKAAVGGMGVLIIIGTTVVFGTIIHRVYVKFNAPSTPVAMVSVPPPLGTVPATMPAALPAAMPAGALAQLAPGEHIAGIASAGAELAVWVNGPNGDRLLLLNPVTGQARAVLASP